MSGATAAGLQLAESNELQVARNDNLHMQPGHTVWLFSAESLNLAGRLLPANLQTIKAFHLVACVDHYYPCLDQSEEAFNAQGDARLALVPTLKAAFTVADEIKTFAGERGCEVLDGLIDKPVEELRRVWALLFGKTPNEPTLQDRLHALPDSLPGYESTLEAVKTALNAAITWRQGYFAARLSNPGKDGRVHFTEQERVYFQEAELEVPDETSTNRATELASVQGGAMGDAIGAAVGRAVVASRTETTAAIGELVSGLKEIITPIVADIQQLKGALNGTQEKDTASDGAAGTTARAAGKPASAKPASGKPGNAA